MHYPVDEFNCALGELFNIIESITGELPKLDRSIAYRKFLKDEYSFIQNICYNYYPTDKIFSGYTSGLEKYKKYNKNVQKTLLHHIIIDNSELFDSQNFSNYRYDNVYLNIKTLDDAIIVFNEISLTELMQLDKLYDDLCDSFSKELIDEIKSEIAVRDIYEIIDNSKFKYELKSREKEREKDLKQLMEINNVSYPVSVDQKIKNLKEKYRKLNKDYNQYLKICSNFAGRKQGRYDVSDQVGYLRNRKNFSLDAEKLKEEYESIKEQEENNIKYNELFITSIANIIGEYDDT